MSEEKAGIDLRRTVMITAVAFALVLWTGWLFGLARSDFREDAGIPSGFEFAMFYGAATMLADGAGAEVYDFDEFRSVMEVVVDDPDRSDEVDAYLLAPFFAALLIPLTVVGYRTAWLVWFVLGVGGLAAGFVLLRARPLPALLTSLVFAPVFWVLRTGQASWLGFVAIAGSYRALDRGSPIAAGMIAGALSYKPQLALGLGVWWLLDRRYWRALAGMAASAIGLAALSWLVAPGWVVPYAEALRGATSWFSNPGFLTFSYAPSRMGTMLFPEFAGANVVFLVAAWAIGIWGFLRFRRRHLDDWRLLFAAAVVLGVWMTPHLLVYDWTLLLVPMTILWIERPQLRNTWVVLGGALALASAVSGPLNDFSRIHVGRGLQIAPIALAVVAVLAARCLERVEDHAAV